MIQLGSIDREAIAFQEELDRVKAEPAPLLLRLWPFLAAALLCGLVGLAAILRVDVVVTAPGQLAAAEPPLLLRPAASTRLDALLVRPGDVVVAGQLLARLDPTQPEADLAALEAERDALSARIARLVAELDGGVLAAGGPALATEADVLTERRLESRTKAEALQAEIASAEALIEAETRDGAGLREQLSILREVETMRNTLAERQSGSQLAVLDARLMRLRAEADQRAHESRLAELRDRRARAIAEHRMFLTSLKRTATEQLAEARPRLQVVEEQIAKARALREMADLVAPRPGVVLRVAEGGVGSLIPAGNPVVVLVPTDVPLLAEIGLRSTDAGRAVAGDPVSIKIDAFPWREHGQLTGTLTEVGHASFRAQGAAEAQHPAHVALDPAAQLSNLPAAATLLPGMTLSAEIHTGTRSVLATFFDPILRGLAEALRDP